MVIYTNPSLVNRLFVILSTPTPVRGNEPGCVATQTPFQANFTFAIFNSVSVQQSHDCTNIPQTLLARLKGLESRLGYGE